MVVSAADVQDTLALLMPGFVATKVFYLMGLPTKRSDTEWVLWSLLVSAPIAAAVGTVEPPGGIRLAIAITTAIGAGALAAVVWQLYRRRTRHAGAFAAIRAWDVVMGRHEAPWVELEDTSGRRFLGFPQFPASSVETDDLDLFLTQPKLLSDGDRIDMPGVEGILFSRSQIAYIAVLEPVAPKASPSIGRSR